MSYHVFFGTTQISDDAIAKFEITSRFFDDTFKLGATACQCIELTIDNTALVNIQFRSSAVFIKDDFGVTAFTMLVDEVENEDDFFTHFSLTDAMVRFNQAFDWRDLPSHTVQDILNAICGLIGEYTCTAPTVSFGGSYSVDWDYGISARDFISYVAEINGSIARIDGAGNLKFAPMTASATTRAINADTVSGYKIGESLTFNSVLYDNGVVTYRSGTGNDTYYVDTDNILFTSPHEQDIVDNIYSVINGLTFYNIEIEQCEINPKVLAGDFLTLTIGGTTYKFIAEIDWEYNGEFHGGYSLNVANKTQEETQVIPEEEKKFAQIRSSIDRQQGTLDIIGTTVEDMETQLIHFQVDAVNSEVKVTNQDASPPTSYTSFKGDGMRIYVDGEVVAEATANRFECDKGLGVQDWAIEQGQSSNTLIIFRKE